VSEQLQVGARCAEAALTGAAANIRRALQDDPHGLSRDFQVGWLAACDAMERYGQHFRDQLKGAA
jgi:hypothetical protein